MTEPNGHFLPRLLLLTGPLCLGLAGCGALTGLYGSAAQDTQLTSTTAGGAPAKIDIDPDAECPQVTVLSGTSAYSGGAAGGSPRFQASIQDFARDCTLNAGNTVAIRVGVQGLVVLGEHGTPGTFSAPLRIAIRDRDGKAVYSKLQRVSVTIPPGETQGAFRIVDSGATVPISFERPLRYYDIVVGFDAKGG